MVLLRIEAELAAERAIVSQLQRYGCRIVERTEDGIRVEFPYAESEREALAEARLYLGAQNGSVLSARAA
ncbi:MAG TPA: hypothetical protein VFA66_02990 [Gaiellaceae bacterium]|nr:hypothetical protein [Gaiellaceae bacterium]